MNVNLFLQSGMPSSVGEAGQTLKEVFIELRRLIIKGGLGLYEKTQAKLLFKLFLTTA